MLFECPEVPYALPPGRFENPVPLPSDFRYQDRDYITESSCQFDYFRVTIFVDVDFVSDAVQPTNDGQATGNPGMCRHSRAFISRGMIPRQDI
jgi:hypothetical protein